MAFLQNIFRKLVRNLLPGNSVEKILKRSVSDHGFDAGFTPHLLLR